MIGKCCEKKDGNVLLMFRIFRMSTFWKKFLLRCRSAIIIL